MAATATRTCASVNTCTYYNRNVDVQLPFLSISIIR